MKILDLSAGNRAIWFDKKNPAVTFLDKRESVNPTFVCDTRTMDPEIIGRDFDLVVFDPPHMNCGPKSDMSKRYGYHTTAEIIDTIEKTGSSAKNITKPNALMALKWNDHDIPLKKVFLLLKDWEPLFGHSLKNMGGSKGGKRSQSFWVLLKRRD